MNPIVFIDTEIDPSSNKINDLGGIKVNGNEFHSGSVVDFISFLKGSQFICGHNIIRHDYKYIQNAITNSGINPENIIDTLFLSPLLYPAKPYHALLKDDKLQSDDLNNPLNDSIKARDLFYDEVSKFNQTEESLKLIFYALLNETKEFKAFFNFLSYKPDYPNIESIISESFQSQICENANLNKIIAENPIELSYCLALINSSDRYSITPRWVLKNFPDVEKIMFALRSKPCLYGCQYCTNALDVKKGLKKYFGFDSYRTYEEKPLQEQAVKAAVDNKSILAVFPTGGGKSITFQVPALMSGEASKGLTVIISPLQSLMKDQVDNLEKVNITDAVTINGLLDPIERAKSFERVNDGSASILYISPESLRSKTIEHLLLGRNIVRFVIDEAHCFSSWGQDFRVDYLYIAEFIKSLQAKKNLTEKIPVSCFTATAKLKVIEDIRDYFKDKLSIDLEIFSSGASRTNLEYKVYEKEDEVAKYSAVRDLLDEKKCPTIIYVSRTKKAFSLAENLTKDGFNAKPYHGKMESKEKSENQNAFISGEVQIMVATSAFGMGVDKKDVGMVIHYEISDSLENYIQEAGRAGRDESMHADCFVLFNEEDLAKHFILLNQTKISIKEIQQIWKAIKEITAFRNNVSNSALEIARKAGWDDSVKEIETRVTTAISALEEAGYLKRGQNMPKIFANSILSKTANEAINKINNSERFNDRQKVSGIRIIKKLFSSKSRVQANDEAAESRIDYISDHLGIVKEEVINIVNLLSEENILADAKDLTAYIKRTGGSKGSLKILETFGQIENFLLPEFEEHERTFHIKELNELAESQGYIDVTPNKLKTIINFWAIKNWLKRHIDENSKNHINVLLIQPKDLLKQKLEKRHVLSKFIIEFLHDKSQLIKSESESEKDEVLVEFSVLELKDEFEKRAQLFRLDITLDDIEDTLFFLSRIDALKIEGGFLVVYNKLTIESIEKEKPKFKKEDYQKLNQFYENRVQQIHIVGEYAKKMIGDYKGALQFVEDYFHLNYTSFLNLYFPGSRQNEIKRNITPAKFRQLFGTLSATQLEIIKDNQTKYIVVAAGPGSGKTRVLVHKLASLLLMEDVKHEQLLMVTFSRAAATEFKKRLFTLIGNAAAYIEIKTFHSYCFDLLGKVGSLEKSEVIIRNTIEKIKNGEVEANRITKTVLVIDEAQDMDANEFALINALIDLNDDMRVIAVGDDDQNIFEFRGASSKYLEEFIVQKNATKHELIENYRSKQNLVEFTNGYVKKINHRLKQIPIHAIQPDNGTIKLVHHQKGNLITPVVNDVLSSRLAGTICVLTQRNDQALQITGLLLKSGMHAKLIQTNDGFSLYNLLEVRYFLQRIHFENDEIIIDDENWNRAKNELKDHFQQSAKLEICLNLLNDFEAINPKAKYKTDLEVFIRESKIEDFYNEKGDIIYVSTIHKAKGKEFDNVFIMLEDFNGSTDEKKRLLYVAMTRAKTNLTIHTNGKYLDDLTAGNLEVIVDAESYTEPNQLVMHMSHNDVKLGYFEFVQRRLSGMVSGDLLTKSGEGYANTKGELVLKFSKKFTEEIILQEGKGYILKEAKVNFILYWKNEETYKEVKIILPEVCFEKK